ncbi:sulfite exporter TauE/SafE family protein [Catellatospora sp. IY07-71]|uniref:sulfite exporter TauE/SafE family protein n=1 Tax=Catellatospora sp. IY07-71 TaxID=2728827 RepID=UPI001BB3AB31|nr:sulfite exporter TauE/SafE family protein [Catellatospora sp. IY07-71]
MTAWLALTLAASVAIGLTLGMLGGGGSILTVPVLVYLADIEPKSAIAMSLVVVGVTSTVALVPHARASRVQWRTGALFGAAGMAGAYVGGRVAQFIPGAVLLVAFAAMMLVTAVAMLRSRRGITAAHRPDEARLPVVKILAEGVAVGLVTGLVGAGGGFLVVPALVLLGGLPMPVAVGTSLLVIAMKSVAGLGGYLHSVSIDWRLTAAVTAVAVLGSIAGGRLAGRIDPALLRRTFGWFVVVMGVGVLAGQLAG